MKTLLNILLLIPLAACTTVADVEPSKEQLLSLIVERQRSVLLEDAVADSAKLNSSEIPRWISTLGNDNRWPDIDYTNKSGGAWLTVDHLRRVRSIAREIASASPPLYGDAQAQQTALRALEHWTHARYKNPNWWQNDIGVPQVMRDIIVLLGERLTGELREGAFAVLRQYKQQPPGYGANTVWTAELALIDGALSTDTDKVSTASRIISDEITVGAAQGIQRDFSFYQHGARLQQFHYGRSFFQDTTRLAWLLRETPWAFSTERISILADYALEGCASMCRGIATVPGTLDRAVSRPGALGTAADLRRELYMLRDLLPTRAKAFERMYEAQKNGGVAVEGFKAFPSSDFSAYQKNEFSFFLKTISTRTEVTETLLRENQKGRYLNWGDHYIMRDGTEYAALPPVWDWDLLPGVTTRDGITVIERQPFGGSVADGESGATAMDYRTSGSVNVLSAKKFWAAHNGTIIALIGSLNGEGNSPVRTALDQCRLRGDVIVADETGPRTIAESFSMRKNVRWILHSGILYMPIGNAAVSLRIGPATGSWKSINQNYSDNPVTEQVFLPILEHGSHLENQSCGFAITTCSTPADAELLVNKPAWHVLANDTRCQAVCFDDGTITAAFYEAGEIKTGNAPQIAVNHPCIILIKNNHIFASDPLHKGSTITVTINGQHHTIDCPPDGSSSAGMPISFR